MRHRWLAGAAFVSETFATHGRGSRRAILFFEGVDFLDSDVFSRVFHNILSGFTASAQIHLAFRFVFAYPSARVL
jgi:hypothetical protein